MKTSVKETKRIVEKNFVMTFDNFENQPEVLHRKNRNKTLSIATLEDIEKVCRLCVSSEHNLIISIVDENIDDFRSKLQTSREFNLRNLESEYKYVIEKFEMLKKELEA